MVDDAGQQTMVGSRPWSVTGSAGSKDRVSGVDGEYDLLCASSPPVSRALCGDEPRVKCLCAAARLGSCYETD